MITAKDLHTIAKEARKDWIDKALEKHTPVLTEKSRNGITFHSYSINYKDVPPKTFSSHNARQIQSMYAERLEELGCSVTREHRTDVISIEW